MKVTINGKAITLKKIGSSAKVSATKGYLTANAFYQANSTDIVANAALSTAAAVNTIRASWNVLKSVKK